MTKKVIKEPRPRSYANWIKGIEAKDGTKPTVVKKPTVRKRVKATTTTIAPPPVRFNPSTWTYVSFDT